MLQKIIKGLVGAVLYCSWPFLAFILYLNKSKGKFIYVNFVLFFFLIGCSFLFIDSELDSYKYAQEFIDTLDFDFNERLLYNNLYIVRTDFYSFIINFLVSKVSNSPRILFGVYASIYGLFIAFFFILIKKEWNRRLNLYVWIIILVVFFICSHANINTVRFWTACWLFFVSLINIIVYKNNNGFYGLFLTPLIHSTYLLFIIFYIIFTLLKNKPRFIYYCFIIGWFFSLFNVNIMSLLPTSFGLFSRYEAYIDVSYYNEVATVSNQRSLLNRMLSSLPFYYIYFVGIYLFRHYYRYLKERYKNVFLYSLFLMAICYILGNIPSMGRFYTLSHMFFVYTIFLVYNQFHNKLLNYIILALIPTFFSTMYLQIVVANSAIKNIYLFGSLSEILNFSSLPI